MTLWKVTGTKPRVKPPGWRTLAIIPYMEYIYYMWEIEYTDEFGEWWETLSEDEQDAID